MRRVSNVVGFDDAPFAASHRGDVLLVGAVCAATRLDGVLATHVRRDGTNATQRMITAIQESPFREHVRAVLLQGIAVAGFNVVDVQQLAGALDLPVVVVTRRAPDLASMRRVLETQVRGGARKWRLIERAGPLEPVRGVLVQRIGMTLADVTTMLDATTLHGKLPEALRLAHLIAGGVTTGVSRGRA